MLLDQTAPPETRSQRLGEFRFACWFRRLSYR